MRERGKRGRTRRPKARREGVGKRVREHRASCVSLAVRAYADAKEKEGEREREVRQMKTGKKETKREHTEGGWWGVQWGKREVIRQSRAGRGWTMRVGHEWVGEEEKLRWAKVQEWVG